MMAFMTVLLRIFISIAIALCIIGGAVAGWFFDQDPFLAKHIAVNADSPAIRGIAAVTGGVLGLIVATLTFGLIATLIDIRDKLIDIRNLLELERPTRMPASTSAPSGRPMNWEKP